MCKEHPDMPGVLFGRLHRAHMNAVHGELNACGLSDLGSPLILFILDHHGNHGEIASQRDLAQALKVSPATVAMSLKSLERLGYVEKRADLQDGRRKRIAITQKGEAAVKQCFEIYHQVDLDMMRGLTNQEQAELERIICKMLENLDAYKENGKGGRCHCSGD